MSTVVHNPCGKALWITLVENSVENVENSQLSTGIFPLLSFHPLWKGCIGKMHNLWNTPGFFRVMFPGFPRALWRVFVEKVGNFSDPLDLGRPLGNRALKIL